MNLLSLIEIALPHFSAVQLETNGTQPKFYRESARRGLTGKFISVVSPKASSKTGKYARIPEEVLANADYLKFVVTADAENVHHTVPEWALEHPENVYVSPMTVYKRNVGDKEVASAWDTTLVDHEKTRANYRYAAELAMLHDFTVSVQMHTWLDME